jgi:hypothetical protein
MRNLFLSLLVVGSALTASSAQAYQNYSPGDLSALSQSNIDDMVKTTSIGTGHRAMQPASSLGLIFGLDIGIEVTGISLPDNFKTALALATQQPASQVPSVVPIPKLNLHKGFPFGVDLGFSYSTYQSTFTVWGIDGQYGFIKSPVDLAGRISYGHSHLYFFDSHILNIDAVASKNLIIIEPYVGLGLQTWSGSLNVTGASVGLPANVSANSSGTTGHFFVGVPIKLGFFHLTGELDTSFAGITTYGGKTSFSF